MCGFGEQEHFLMENIILPMISGNIVRIISGRKRGSIHLIKVSRLIHTPKTGWGRDFKTLFDSRNEIYTVCMQKTEVLPS